MNWGMGQSFSHHINVCKNANLVRFLPPDRGENMLVWVNANREVLQQKAGGSRQKRGTAHDKCWKSAADIWMAKNIVDTLDRASIRTGRRQIYAAERITWGGWANLKISSKWQRIPIYICFICVASHAKINFILTTTYLVTYTVQLGRKRRQNEK